MSSLFLRINEMAERWAFSGDSGKSFAALFDAQMWCLGCDVRHAPGNILLEYGFSRRRPPRNLSGSSRYTKEIDDEYRIDLWGFAIIVANKASGICLKRHEHIPLMLRPSVVARDVWRSDDKHLPTLFA